MNISDFYGPVFVKKGFQQRKKSDTFFRIYIFDSYLVWRMQFMIIKG